MWVSAIIIFVIFGISAGLRIQENGSVDRTPYDYDQSPAGKRLSHSYRQSRFTFRIIMLLLVGMGLAVLFGNP